MQPLHSSSSNLPGDHLHDTTQHHDDRHSPCSTAQFAAEGLLDLHSILFSSDKAGAMPTPESAAFLAKKPTVPPTFDGVDYDDNKKLKQAQDAIIREQWVQVMMGRLIREELSKCYYREGVNHLEKCGHLRG